MFFKIHNLSYNITYLKTQVHYFSNTTMHPLSSTIIDVLSNNSDFHPLDPLEDFKVTEPMVTSKKIQICIGWVPYRGGVGQPRK